MLSVAWPPGYWRDARWLAGWLALILAIVFSPFLFGPFTLLTGAADAPSLYLSGAAPNWLQNRSLKELDPGAPAWQSEPALQIEHDALFVDHRLPWWDPYDGYGAPFAASQQPQPFYPLTAIAAIHPSPRVWNAYIVARLFVAGFFGGLFVRFSSGRFGALGAALATSFAGYYLIYYSMPHLSVETLVPAVLWATEWLVRRPSIGATAGLASVIGAVYLGGMPESSALALSAAVIYLCVRLRTSDPAPRPFARCLSFIGGNLAGAAIGAAMLLPFLEYLPYGSDTHRVGPWPGLGYDGTPLVHALFQRLVPLSYGPPLNTLTDISGAGFSGLRGWFGAAAGLLALIAVLDLVRPRGPQREVGGPILGVAAITVLFLGKSLGAPWINWIGGLPVYRLIGFPKYNEALIDVSVALLCGLGIAAFEGGRRPGRWVPLIATIVVAAVLTIGFREALHVVPPGRRALILYDSVTLAALAAVAVFAFTHAEIPKRIAAALLAAVVGIEVIANYYVPMYGYLAEIPSAARNPYAEVPYIRALHAAGHEGLRVIGVGGPLWPNWAGAHRLDDPQALNGLYPSRYLPFVNAFLTRRNAGAWEDLLDRFDGSSDPSLVTPSALRWMELSSIGFVVTAADHPLVNQHLKQIYAGDARIYAFDAPMPRAGIFHAARSIAADADVLRMLGDPRVDLRHTLIVSTSAPLDGTVRRGATSDESAHIVRRDVSSVTIDATLAQPGFVMLNDTDAPGWQATIDNEPVPVLRADYLFRAIAVPAGRHRLAFAYHNRSDILGLVISACGIAAVCGYGVFAFATSRRRRTASVLPAEA